MGIRFRCHHCECELHVKDFQAGKRGRCPACKRKFRIPLTDAEHSLSVEERPLRMAWEEETFESDLSTEEASIAIPSSLPSAAGDSAVVQRSDVPSAEPASGHLPPVVEPQQPRALAEAPEAKWYVRPTSGGQYGPAPSESMMQWLSENRVGRDALVWCEGWPDWLVASQAFSDYFAASGITPVANSPVPPTDREPIASAAIRTSPSQPLPAERSRIQRKLKRRRNYTATIAVLSVLMVVLVVSLIIVLLRQS